MLRDLISADRTSETLKDDMMNRIGREARFEDPASFLHDMIVAVSKPKSNLDSSPSGRVNSAANRRCNAMVCFADQSQLNVKPGLVY